MLTPIATDQPRCFNTDGAVIPCQGTGQDGEYQSGLQWPSPRFEDQGLCVLDKLTSLMWTKDANPGEFPLSWDEAFLAVKSMNRDKAHGFSDWCIPSRQQLFSLISHMETNPALPAEHPFTNVFSGYYWTSDTCARFSDQAWYVHLGGARVFSGMKHGSYMVWPVRQEKIGWLETCSSSLDRFVQHGGWVEDTQTGLAWIQNTSMTPEPVSWNKALGHMRFLDEKNIMGFSDWRLPNIRELESLVDLKAHTPALTPGHPFVNVGQGYWSSTTSVYDPAYAWVLYTQDGRVGVGFKAGIDFFTWPVRTL